MTILHVACAAEGRYAAHSAAMLHSVAASRGEHEFHAHYLHGPEFSRRDADAIRAMLAGIGAAASFHEIAPERVAALPVVDMFTKAMWYRIFLPELVPEAERMLYLDVDTLALDDIAPLWQLDMAGFYVGAVTNVLMPHHRHRPASLGLANDSYFNSGVLLMNLDAMRREGTSAELHRYAKRHRELEWPDQDALNVVLGSRRLALRPRWNAMNSLRFPWAAEVFAADELEEARRRPAIRHFEGPADNKPWHRGCARSDRELYARHRRATPWPRVKLEGSRMVRPRRLAGRVRRRLRA